ncbi:type VI immunity family protein [Agrobacterium vaccinii]|uniref:type VI immunity family protein n=1 Tax=Agrobacterium vaccinii TaxID=2735528 RepID=UPI001E60F73A|nr:type VI immunity family protein [Agrobacterium vaccinii]UHS59700.1 DUF3396 domain-containing protein [Agrobacterium vaccinii]
MSNDELLQSVQEGAGMKALDDLVIRSPRSGKVLVRVGLRVSLKFRDGHTLDKRLAMVEMWHSYYDTFKEHLSHWQKPDATRLTKLKNEFPPFEQLARDISTDQHFDGCLWGFPNEETLAQPALYEVGGLCLKSLKQNKNSYVDANIPASWAVAKGWDRFRELVQHWCDILQAIHGTAGPSLLFEPAMGSIYLEDAYGLLKRFPSLDHEESGLWSNEVGDNIHKIRTINWLTVLGEPLIAEIGGRETMRTALHDERPILDCPMFDYEGGTVIQAGGEPELGDLNFGFVPETYRKVAQLTKPLRFEGYRSGALAGVPKPLDNLEETRSWIARFD